MDGHLLLCKVEFFLVLTTATLVVLLVRPVCITSQFTSVLREQLPRLLHDLMSMKGMM